MQKSYLPLLISATVCGTLLADVSVLSSGDHRAPDMSMSQHDGFALAFTTDSFSGGLDSGFTFSVGLETLNNEFTTANNRATLALAYEGGFGFAATGMQPAAFYGASVSHSTYDEALSDQNTLAAKMGLAIASTRAYADAKADVSTHRILLDVTYLTADDFLGAGNTQNGTVGVGGSMRPMEGLTFGAGIKAGRTATDNGRSTDLVGADSFGYSVVTAGLKYATGKMTFNGAMSRTETSEAVGAGSSDSVTGTSASISYAVASGVTAILGHTYNATEYGVQKDDGSAWYIGANLLFAF